MHKKFIFNLLIISIPFAFLIFIVNLSIDSGLIFHNRNLEIAPILVSGKNAAISGIPSKWGGLQKAIVNATIETNKKYTDNKIIVFGTSRSSEINGTMFKNNNFFNCALPGGNILDYIALYGLYKQSNLLPKYLIINIDPWSFHYRKRITIKNKIEDIAEIITPLKVNSDLIQEYAVGLKYLGFNNQNIETNNSRFNTEDIIELFNPNYFQLNFPYLFKKPIMETGQSDLPPYFIIRSDGGYSLVKQSQIDSISVRIESYQFVDIHKSIFFIAKDTTTIYWEYFKKLLLQLKSDGVEQIIYMSPVNPIVFDKLSDSPVVDLEKSIDSFCKINSITRVGSFNPHKYGYNQLNNYFMDAYHPVKSVIEKIFYFHINELKSIGIILTKN